MKRSLSGKNGPRRSEKIKILHLIDGLGGGGSEEWVKDIVRLADGKRFEFMVVSIIRGFEDRFSYKNDIENLGAKVTCLEEGQLNINGSTIEQEISLIKGIVNHHLPSNLTSALSGIIIDTIKNGKIINLTILALKALMLIAKLFALIKREKIDIIHAHLFYSFIFGGIAGRMLNVPFVYTVPAMKSQLDGPFPWVFPMYRRFSSLADVFVSGISKEELSGHCNVSPNKIVIIQASVDLTKITSISRDSNPIISELGLEDSYPILLSVARFDPTKGHKYSLEAIKSLKDKFPDIKLIILGEGNEFEEYKDLVKNDELLKNSVILPGFVKDPANFYSAADIYLRTGIYEGMNRASTLAMAHGKPIIGFDTKAPTEAIVDGDNGLLIPTKDSDGLAKAIDILATDKELQKEMGENAHTYVLENLNMMDTIKTFENLYSKLVSS